MRHFRRRWAIGGIVLFAVAGAATVALASNFYSTAVGGSPANNVSLANNSSHLVRFASVQAAQKASTLDRMSAAYNTPTDITMTETTSTTADDVVVFDFTYGLNGAVAWVVCPDAAFESGSDPNRWCFGQELRYNLTYADYYDTSGERAWIACHELGHTIGLNHVGTTNSCLRLNYNGTTLLSPHDVSHVNSNY